MKTFNEGNWSNGDKCPFCNTDKEGEIVLVPIIGTQEGNLSQAIQIHTKCIEERWYYTKEFDVLIAKK